jgi:hypothetical protein
MPHPPTSTGTWLGALVLGSFPFIYAETAPELRV